MGSDGAQEKKRALEIIRSALDWLDEMKINDDEMMLVEHLEV